MHLESRRKLLCHPVTAAEDGAGHMGWAYPPSWAFPPQASDKRKALEETMAMSTQSLASVTYQVSSLATAFLRLLDLQAAELQRVEADVSCLAQVGPSSSWHQRVLGGWVLRRGRAPGEGDLGSWKGLKPFPTA